jgi:acyl dehydratase
MPTNAEKAMEIWKTLEGKPEGTGDWLQVDQARINTFADATGDHQFIHVDPEKAAQFSPYKVTIAHGYLTISLIPFLQIARTAS